MSAMQTMKIAERDKGLQAVLALGPEWKRGAGVRAALAALAVLAWTKTLGLNVLAGWALGETDGETEAQQGRNQPRGVGHHGEGLALWHAVPPLRLDGGAFRL